MPNFLDLPPEIRNAIYRLICVAEGPAQINAIAIDLRSAFPDDPRPRFTFASPLTETEVRFSVVDEQLRFYNTLWIINGKLRYEMITFLLSENPIMTRHRLSPLEGVLGTSMSYVRRLVLLPDMSSKVRRPPEGQRFLREIGFASKSLPNLECLDFYMSVAKHSGLQCSQNASEASEDFELAFGLEHGECERRAVLTDIKADDASFTLNNMVNAATSSAISSCSESPCNLAHEILWSKYIASILDQANVWSQNMGVLTLV